ncbi:DnaJ-domain-containing protein [Calocera cornea HHB12733]|uniref:Diphthamide biosynthesis protein 4 n=1 Tax=Calocera cornea HHB12733 TaxID=1353952 RepID=A0A165D071_9BASI|nr:DnaJ-domain-containing protein [Calocera cornea HHB12733]
MTITTTTYPSYYTLLGVTENATQQQIKQAYHRLVLQHHPDKRRSTSGSVSPAQNGASPPVQQSETVDIGRLTIAYATLSSAERRKEYDERLKEEESGAVPRDEVVESKIRRPAEVVSLDDFSLSMDDRGEVWIYPCRCGSLYKIREADMEADLHLLECGGCSEVVWVEFEEAGEDIADTGMDVAPGGDDGV